MFVINLASGYGKKSDLDYGKHRHNKSPSPDHYKIDSFVEANKTHKTGWTTAIGREMTQPRSFIDLEKVKTPGPGRYEEFRYNETAKWSMRPQTKSARK